jgi:hypothetical protein
MDRKVEQQDIHSSVPAGMSHTGSETSTPRPPEESFQGSQSESSAC